MGTRKEQRISSDELEINEKHLKVRGAHGNRDVATRNSDTEE